MGASIDGIGLALPEHWVTQQDATQHALATSLASNGQRNFAERVYSNAGIMSRHSVLLEASSQVGEPVQQSYYHPASEENRNGPSTADRMESYKQHASTLAHQAASEALADAGVEPGQVTQLVTVSCSGFYAPGFDVSLIQGLPLDAQVGRTHVGFMGCHGALNGLRVARMMADADPSACVLLVAVELCSLHYQYDWTPQRIVSNSLFADGAAALVLRGGDSDGLPVRDNWSHVAPDSVDAMTWNIGDHGFEMTLSPEVPTLIDQTLPTQMQAWLARHDLTIETVRNWAVHPGGPKILEACESALNLPPSALAASRTTLSKYGNMSSPTVLFVLRELLRSNGPGPTVMLGFGPGLAIEAALVG